MRELIAGEGGSVLVCAASSLDAVALACEGLSDSLTTPSGVPVYPTAALPDELDVDRVRLLPCEPKTLATVRSWAATRGTEVVDDVPPRLRPPDGVQVVSVSAASTGSGKTALTRRVARTLSRSGVSVAVARHPIASLLAWGRFDPVVVRSPPELGSPRPVDEREELAPVVGTGVPVVVGLDAGRVLRLASREGSIVVWDGGGAAPPCVEADLGLLAIDLLRPRTVDLARVREADVIVLCKADSAPEEQARSIEAQVREACRPDASVLLADLSIGVQPVNVLPDRRVVIVEDSSSLMLGGMSAGAGAVAARRFRCSVVDPHRFAVGAIADALRAHPHIGAVIPSLGRTPQEIEDLAASVAATPGEVVLWASNADPAAVVPGETRPIVRAYGELTEVAGPALQDVLAPLIPGYK